MYVGVIGLGIVESWTAENWVKAEYGMTAWN